MYRYLKRLTPAVLIVWPYLFFLSALSHNQDFHVMFLCGYMVFTIFVYGLNIIYAFRCQDRNPACQLAFWNMLIKLLHIPFYFLVFCTGIVLLVSMVVPAFIMLSPIMILTLFLIDLFLMVTSSMYGVSALIKAKRSNMITGAFATLHILLHFIFVADTISSIIVYKQLKFSVLQQP